MEQMMISAAGLVTRELGRGHAVEELPHEPQRREARSAAEPQPRPGETGRLRTGKCTGSHFPVFNLPVFMLSCGPAKDFLAACEQFRVLQCGEKREEDGAHPSHLSVIFDRVAENGLPQRSSRLCGSFGPAPTE